jgi:hypothetical protein
MERLAWIEILDRHGDVVIRHPVYAWPVKLGRAYTSDIVLDDPYVAASHLEINSTADGRYQLNGLGSINGLITDALRTRQTDATASANDVVRIGQTQFRIRPVDYAVAAEKSLPSDNWLRSWPALFVGVIVLLLSELINLWLDYISDDIYNILLIPILISILFLSLWAGFWALIGRVQSGRANFIAHAVIASLGISLLMLIDSMRDYLFFAFDSHAIIQALSFVPLPVICGALLYKHICLVSRVDRRKLGTTVALLMACLVGAMNVPDKWIGKDDDLANMPYSRTIGPPSMLLAHGISTEKFLTDASVLRTEVEE